MTETKTVCHEKDKRQCGVAVVEVILLWLGQTRGKQRNNNQKKQTTTPKIRTHLLKLSNVLFCCVMNTSTKSSKLLKNSWCKLVHSNLLRKTTKGNKLY